MAGIGFYEILIIVFILAIVIVPFFLAYSLAKKKNRSIAGWMAGTFFFGWFAVLVLALLSDNREV